MRWVIERTDTGFLAYSAHKGILGKVYRTESYAEAKMLAKAEGATKIDRR